MIGVSGLMGGGGSADRAADSGGASGSEVRAHGGAMEEIGVGGGGGNRWPKQETLALLQIRSDMDAVFKDSSLKGPLWEEVSRKMAELGYHRTAKKCKEKFENVNKYHKRTKDGRASKSDGKTYRFFDQLEALEGNNSPPHFNPLPPRAAQPVFPSFATVSSISPNPITVLPPNPNSHPMNSSLFHSSQPPFQPSIPAMDASNQNQPPPQIYSFQTQLPPASLLPNTTSSSSTSSDEDIQRRRGRKRKWKDFFHRLMKDVIHKQEELHRKFLDTLEKRERERMARDEAWRAQETARVNREHEILAQERSMAAAKDAAVLAFLQKVTEQHNLQIPIGNSVQLHVTPPENSVRPPPIQTTTPSPPPPPPSAVAPPVAPSTKLSDSSKGDTSGEKDHPISSGSSRWPKTEVQALIELRTCMDLKYQETGPKGPLWEEISSAMSKLGYSRNAKRCKEKWENINKYFKKVKESSKKRPEDSKTCPYFHQLDALYREKARPENQTAPIMARPEQQWPLPEHSQPQTQSRDSAMAHRESDREEEDGDDDDDAAAYEMVANKQQSPSTADTAV